MPDFGNIAAGVGPYGASTAVRCNEESNMIERLVVCDLCGATLRVGPFSGGITTTRFAENHGWRVLFDCMSHVCPKCAEGKTDEELQDRILAER